MIIVDSALQKREMAGHHVHVALVGAGYMGRGIALQFLTAVKGMKLAAISNRTVASAEHAYLRAGADSVNFVETVEQLEESIAAGQYAVTNDPFLLCQAKSIDVIIEATGDVEFSAQVVMNAIENRKHVVLMNAELDALVGPILKKYADENHVVITNADGDQPGVVMNLLRSVKTTYGCEPVLAGNIKGLQDYYRTPETQRDFADKHNLTPQMATSFADGTKISMEMAVVANATGFKVGRRGMYGPSCAHITEALDLFPKEDLLNGGLVDYVLGAEPSPGVFAIGYNDHPLKKPYMNYFKMGDGPFYIFYTPYHLPHLEVAMTAARAALFHDAAIAPVAGPVCDVITVAKRDLNSGEILDGIGGFTCYGMLENAENCQEENLLPMGQSQNCRLIRSVAKDQAITHEDVVLPPGRLSDKLREEQNEVFYSEHKLAFV
ncbi:MAG: NAD(P)H-dependent oxidoreductase [bacterium]